MEGELYGEWDAIGANGIRANEESGVPLTPRAAGVCMSSMPKAKCPWVYLSYATTFLYLLGSPRHVSMI